MAIGTRNRIRMGDALISRLIFGTAQLFRAGLSPHRQVLLETAYEQGMTHFDTAPLYGAGVSERELGRFLASKPEATVTTKVGLYFPGGADQIEALIALRKGLGRRFRPLSRSIENMDLEHAKRSFEGSLRRLRRERVELLMLHEPIAGQFERDDWQSWLEAEKSSGRIGDYGIAVAPERLETFLASGEGPLGITQVHDSLDGREAEPLLSHGLPLQITFGYIGSAVKAGRTDVVDSLCRAMQRNRDGAIVVSTRHVDRVLTMGRALRRFETSLID
ncbi:hypothetical protein A9995_04930 [Erythrobacter sp. QSSC1-22B]|nr:hypothetical protein A9995_04930 [Erythrobacter sp. QSSC1-22B]